jgi:hypothetical protein
MSSPRITYTQRSDATLEAELNALANIYRYVLFDSQAERGSSHDLTNKMITEHVGKRTTEQTEREIS